MAGGGNSTTQAHSRLMSEELIEQMYSDFLNVWIQFVLNGLITVLQSLTCLHLVSYVTKAQSCSYHLTTDEPPLASRLWVSLWLFFPCIMQSLHTTTTVGCLRSVETLWWRRGCSAQLDKNRNGLFSWTYSRGVSALENRDEFELTSCFSLRHKLHLKLMLYFKVKAMTGYWMYVCVFIFLGQNLFLQI